MAGYYLRPTSPVAAHASLLPDAMGDPPGSRRRHIVNWVNLSTPLGLLVARAGGSRVRRGPARTYLADYYRWTFPAGGAFTVGDVIITRHDLDLLAEARPTLLGHELIHSEQWARFLGLPFLPVYVASMGWSWLRTGDRAARSFLEREAGLESGGYRDVEVRPLGPVLTEASRRLLKVVGIGRRGLDQGADLGFEHGPDLGIEDGADLGIEQGPDLGSEDGPDLGIEQGTGGR